MHLIFPDYFFIMMPGWGELIIILLILLLVFGARRLPEIAKSLGKGIKVFKKTISNADEDHDENTQKSEDNN